MESGDTHMWKKRYENQKLWILLYIIFGLLAAVSLIQGCRNAIAVSQDFQWDAAKALTLRINPYIESLTPTGILDQYHWEDYCLQMEANQFPSLLMLLFPYTLLAPLTARYVWLASNLLFTVLMIVLLRKTFLAVLDRRLFILLMLVMISGTPYRNQLGVGQHTIFSFLFFLAAVYFSRRREESGKAGYTAGTILCLAVSYFKYTLTVPLALYFVYKRKWKELILSVMIHVGLTIFAAFWLHTGILDMIIQPLQVSSALAAEGGIDFGALLQGSPLAFVLAGIVMIFLFIMMLKMPQGVDAQIISMLVLWSLIVTYHRTYDFFVLVVVAALFCGAGQDTRKSLKNGMLCYYLILMVLVNYVLRIFSEALPALICVGALYYIFTIWVTLTNIRIGRAHPEQAADKQLI